MEWQVTAVSEGRFPGTVMVMGINDDQGDVMGLARDRLPPGSWDVTATPVTPRSLRMAIPEPEIR